MKAVPVITLIAAIYIAIVVQAKDNIETRQKHSSEGEGSQSLPISSRAKHTNAENASASILPEPYEMDMLDGSELNEEESFVLVPLKTLVKNSRKPRDTNAGRQKDPLYVMIPYKELSRKSKDFGEPVNIIANDDRIALKRNVPLDGSSYNTSDRKEHFTIPPYTKKLVKRFFKNPNSHDASNSKIADSEALWEIPLSKYLSNGVNPYSLVRPPKATYKSKKSLAVNDIKKQLPKELFSSNQKTRIFTEFRDLNSKAEDLQNIMSKQKKGSNGPVNITMYITNLIPPCEVDSTKITNSGKLFRNGCLKFSIQLEKPSCGMGSDSCCTDECCNNQGGGGGGKQPCCSGSMQQKMGCSHMRRINDDKNSVAVAAVNSNHQTDCPAGSASQNVWHSGADSLHLGGSGSAKPVSFLTSTPSEPPCKIESNPAASRDVTSLLMQLMGLEKKPAKKPAQPQAVLMDNDIVKELQRLLSSNLGSTPASAAVSLKSNFASGQTLSPIAQHNPKAKAIADALNLFSKFTSMRQPIK